VLRARWPDVTDDHTLVARHLERAILHPDTIELILSQIILERVRSAHHRSFVKISHRSYGAI
jgi:hypothetical protein